MLKLNFKGFVTTCAVSLFAVSSANAQQGGAAQRLNIESNVSDTQVLLNAGVIASQDIQGWDTSNVPSISRQMRQAIFSNGGSKNLVGLRRKLPSVPRHFFGSKVIKGTNYTVDELETAGFTRSEVEEAMNDTPFTRNMVNKDLDNACKSHGSAQNCAETFEAAAIVVAVLDPSKGGAAEWTGRKAKEVSEDLVKLGGTQEQLVKVVQFATSNVKFIEQSLPSNTRIDGPKEAAAVNLVKAAIKVLKLDTTSNQDEDALLETATNLLSTLNTVESMGVVSVNNNIISPVGQAIPSSVPAKAITTDDGVSGSDFSDNEAGGIKVMVENNSFSQKVEAMTSLREKIGMIDHQVHKNLISYQVEKAQQAKQNDAPTTVHQVELQLQIQQHNCNQLFQDCSGQERLCITNCYQVEPQVQVQQQNCNPQYKDC